MGDTSADWRKTGQQIAIPARKSQLSRVGGFPSNYFYDALSRKAQVSTVRIDYEVLTSRIAAGRKEEEAYPRGLVLSFGIGAIVFVIGALFLLVSSVIENDTARITAIVLSALGSTAIIFAILRLTHPLIFSME
jgi:hypothetical protein